MIKISKEPLPDGPFYLGLQEIVRCQLMGDIPPFRVVFYDRMTQFGVVVSTDYYPMLWVWYWVAIRVQISLNLLRVIWMGMDILE